MLKTNILFVNKILKDTIDEKDVAELWLFASSLHPLFWYWRLKNIFFAKGACRSRYFTALRCIFKQKASSRILCGSSCHIELHQTFLSLWTLEGPCYSMCCYCHLKKSVQTFQLSVHTELVWELLNVFALSYQKTNWNYRYDEWKAVVYNSSFFLFTVWFQRLFLHVLTTDWKCFTAHFANLITSIFGTLGLNLNRLITHHRCFKQTKIIYIYSKATLEL